MTSEIITKQFKRGMTVEQIAALHSVNESYVEEMVGDLAVERKVVTEEERSKFGVVVPVDYKKVAVLLEAGYNLPSIAKIMNIKYQTLARKVNKQPELKQKSKEVSRQPQPTLAAQETAVTTECDGFAENFTIAALMKEEEEMTEAIAEVKQETEERDVRNDKWVHFVANQIEHAKVKTKFDVVDRDGKLVKQTEVRFVIEEELA